MASGHARKTQLALRRLSKRPKRHPIRATHLEFTRIVRAVAAA